MRLRGARGRQQGLLRVARRAYTQHAKHAPRPPRFNSHKPRTLHAGNPCSCMPVAAHVLKIYLSIHPQAMAPRARAQRLPAVAPLMVVALIALLIPCAAAVYCGYNQCTPPTEPASHSRPLPAGAPCMSPTQPPGARPTHHTQLPTRTLRPMWRKLLWLPLRLRQHWQQLLL